jgi:hypothetical protein
MSAHVTRQCGDCQLCCRLLPVPPLGKKANQRCQHQKFGEGCKVYRTYKMPMECAVWNCRWLVSNDTAELSRPDRSHYVIDIMPDFITIQDNASGAEHSVQVVQIWVDPKHPEAHRDPALRRYLLRRGAEGIVGLIRFDSSNAMTLIPPNMASDNQWHEHMSQRGGPQHRLLDILEAIGSLKPEESVDRVLRGPIK